MLGLGEGESDFVMIAVSNDIMKKMEFNVLKRYIFH